MRFITPTPAKLPCLCFIRLYRKTILSPVSQSNPVNEMILGTHICGQSYIQGTVTPILVENPNAAAVLMSMTASFSSNNIGTNRGVKIHTRGSSHIHVTESLLFTDRGLVATGDTCVSAPLRTDILSIDHRLRIVEKIATKKAAEQKPKADAIGESRLKTRLGTQFHAQLQEQLNESNGRLTPPATPVLTRFGIDKPSRTSSSSGQFLNLNWKQQSLAQLASARPCPIPPPAYGIAVQMHQSALTNAVDPVLSGRILRNGDLNRMVKQFGVEPTQKMVEEANGEPWAITMAGFHPVEIEFDDQLIRFRIRTTKLDRGDQALEQQASIVASYKVVLVDGGIQLERVGTFKLIS